MGIPYQHVVETLSNYLAHFGYRTNPVQLSSFFGDLLIKLKSPLEPEGTDRTAQSIYKIKAGNEIRLRTKEAGVLALVAAGAIAEKRIESKEPDPQMDLQFEEEKGEASAAEEPHELEDPLAARSLSVFWNSATLKIAQRTR